MPFRIDARKLIEELGGVPAVVSALKSVKGSNAITDKGVEKWREKSSISMTRWLELVEYVRRAEKRTLVIDDYLVRGR